MRAYWKTICVGAASGAVAFAILTAVQAQTSLTVAQFHSNQKAYVGSSVTITGMAKNIRSETKKRNGIDVAYTTLNLYEMDAKGKQKPYYVYVSLPTSAFSGTPADGATASITGTMKWPYSIGAIDQ